MAKLTLAHFVVCRSCGQHGTIFLPDGTPVSVLTKKKGYSVALAAFSRGEISDEEAVWLGEAIHEAGGMYFDEREMVRTFFTDNPTFPSDKNFPVVCADEFETIRKALEESSRCGEDVAGD